MEALSAGGGRGCRRDGGGMTALAGWPADATSSLCCMPTRTAPPHLRHSCIRESMSPSDGLPKRRLLRPVASRPSAAAARTWTRPARAGRWPDELRLLRLGARRAPTSAAPLHRADMTGYWRGRSCTGLLCGWKCSRCLRVSVALQTARSATAPSGPPPRRLAPDAPSQRGITSCCGRLAHLSFCQDTYSKLVSLWFAAWLFPPEAAT